MQKNVSVFNFVIVFILIICPSFNYTFPLHRDPKKPYFSVPWLASSSQKCPSLENIADRKQKIIISNIENAYQKFRNSTQDLGKNVQEYVSRNEESFKQYEKLVMLKKYPYLDLNELYLRFSSFVKRHDESEPSRYIGSRDASLCEPPEDCPNVEITNRGLSGFAIPIIRKQSEVKDPAIVKKKSSRQQFLNSLRGEVERFGKL